MDQPIDILLYPGERGFIVGSSGSGKTNAAVQLVMNMQFPRLVFNAKYDDTVNLLVHHGFKIVYGLPSWKEIEQDTIVLPNPENLDDLNSIDLWFSKALRESRYVLSIYIDEGMFSGSNARKVGLGVTTLFSQSRSHGWTILFGTQKPKHINPYVMSEANKFYVFNLQSDKDRERIYEWVDYKDVLDPIPKYHFWFYEQGEKPILIEPLDDFKANVNKNLTNNIYDDKIQMNARNSIKRLIY